MMDGSQVCYTFSLHPILHIHVSVSASVSQELKQQILQPLSVLRPKFRVSEFFINNFQLLTHL